MPTQRRTIVLQQGTNGSCLTLFSMEGVGLFPFVFGAMTSEGRQTVEARKRAGVHSYGAESHGSK